MHSYLAGFDPTDFSPAAQQMITSLLSEQPPHPSRLFKLVGILNMTDQMPTLRSVLPSLSERNRWTAQLALARLGNQEALTTVLARAKRYPVDDDVVYELLPNLVYTRQKEVLDYLVSIVHSEEKNCQSADPEAEQNILCGYRVLELLAPVIRDFPLALDESGDLAVSGYPKALAEAREWLNKHTDYEAVR